MSKEHPKNETTPETPTEEVRIKTNPIIDGNIRIFRYLNKNSDQKFVDWSIDVYLHSEERLATLHYHTRWERLMSVVDEIEKEEVVASVTISGKGTVIRFKNGNSPDIFVKTSTEKDKEVDKKQACWRTIVNFMVYLEKKQAREKVKEEKKEEKKK